jgi:hypothetical protein
VAGALALLGAAYSSAAGSTPWLRISETRQKRPGMPDTSPIIPMNIPATVSGLVEKRSFVAAPAKAR